jgi:hypothetical protein
MGCVAGIVSVVALTAAFCSEICRILLFGWIAFLGRTIPRATVNPSGVVSGLVAIALLIALVHYFGRGLLRAAPTEPGAPPRQWRFRWTLCFVVAVMLMFAVGYSAIGLARHLGWALSSSEPAYSARVYGLEWPHGLANTTEVNNLKQIGIAFHSYHDWYHDVDKSFPAGATYSKSGEPLHSWATQLLPFLNYSTEIRAELPWNHPENAATFQSPIREFYNPTLHYTEQFDGDGFALIHYAGNSKVLYAGSKITFSDIRDGLSNTILLGEVNGNFQPWGKPGNWRDPAAGINTPAGFGGAKASGGAQFLMVDASVRFVSRDVDPQVLKALSTPAGGENLPADWGVKR